MSDIGWYGRTWYDRRQNERIDSISDRIASQRAEARRIQKQLSTVTGDLSQRVDELTVAFESFVELSDIREELRAFDAEGEARQQARRVLRRLFSPATATGVGAGGTLGGAADGPLGYWLPGAAAGLLATADGRTEAAAGELAEARACDPVRTDLFLGLGLLLSGRASQAVDLLPTIFDFRPDQPITWIQRELWRAIAAGALGPDGRAHLVTRLTALVTELDGDARTAEVARWRGVIDQLPVSGAAPAPAALPKRITLPSTMLAPGQALARLEALADWYQQALAGPTAPTDAATPDAPRSTAPTKLTESLIASLHDLVDEGSPDERPLLARVAALRQVMATNGGPAANEGTHWDDPVDTPLALLAGDVRASSPDDVALRAVAAEASGTLVAAVADNLAATASQPVPDRVEIRIGRHNVGYRMVGVDPASTAEAQQRVLNDPHPPSALPASLGFAAIGAGAAVLLVCVLVGVAGLGVLALLVGGALGAYVLLTANEVKVDGEHALRRRKTEWDETERTIHQVESALSDARSQAQDAAAKSSAARARLYALLPTTAIPAAPPVPPADR